jgi:hypothetical protein
MRRCTALALCIALAPTVATAAPLAKNTQTKLDAVARTTLTQDFRLVFHLEKNAQICGGEGDAYVADVEMNKPERALETNGQPTLKDHWVKVGKRYSISARELNEPNATLFDDGNCLE